MTARNVTQHMKFAAYWWGRYAIERCDRERAEARNLIPTYPAAHCEGAALGNYMRHALEVSDAIERNGAE